MASPQLSWSVLSKQNAESTNSIIDFFAHDALFERVAAAETQSILQRDDEDAEKLNKGIQLAIAKGVLEADVQVEPVTDIDVLGKSPSQVADEIISHIPANNEGKVIVLHGLSGTGKGTTVAELQSKLPNTLTWSNGNLFRSMTLLALAKCKESGVPLSDEALTPELLHEVAGMLSFGKFNNKFDTKITGLGYDTVVSVVELTELKTASVSSSLPTVAKVTQGEVVKFASDAIAQMRSDGMNVLVEGREATLNYVRSPYRFNLTLSDKQLIGKRRCAQKVMAKVLKSTTVGADNETALVEAANMAVAEIAQEWNL
jgi:cytidylate kinase